MEKRISVADKEFLNLEEAAAWMGVGKTRITQWRDEGLRYYRFAGRTLYRKRDIAKFMERYAM